MPPTGRIAVAGTRKLYTIQGMNPIERLAGRMRRFGALVWMALEPLIAITLLLCVTGITLHVTHMLARGHLVAAIVVPLELACMCALLNKRFERRAQAQEYMLTELVLWAKGDLAQAFPLRSRRARERVETQTPVLRQLAQDLLEIGRESPCAVSRVMSAWVALVDSGHGTQSSMKAQ